MKKALVALIISSALGANFCLGAGVKGNTLPQGASGVSKLSSTDMEMLFGTSEVDAMILSQEEMKATEGEFLGGWFLTLCKKCFVITYPCPVKY